MARKVEVEIIGDSRKLVRAFSQSSKAAKDFNRDIGRALRGGVAGSGAFKSLGRSVAFASGAFLGGAGLVSTLKASVDASSNLSEQMSKTQKVFDDSAQSVVAWSKTSATAMGLAQDQALETASSFGSLLRPLGLTGDAAADQSEKLTQLGADLASFYNTSVQDALDAVRSGIVGESEPLRKYGVLLSETRVQQEALTETGKKNVKQLTNQDKAMARITLIFRDAALAQGDFQKTSGGLANQQRILTARIRDLEIQIGNQLKPVILEVVSAISDWLAKSENQKQVTDTVRGAVNLVVGAFKTLKGIMETLNSVTGSTKNTLKLLLGVFLAFKTAKLVATFADIATSVGLIGTKAAAASGEATALRTSLMNLSTLGPIGIAVAITVTSFALQPTVTKYLNKLFSGIGLRSKPTPTGGGPLGGRSRLVFRHGRLVWSGSGAPYQHGQTRDPGGRLAGGTKPLSQDPFATARGAFAQPAPRRPPRTTGRGGRRFGGSFLDLLQLRVDQAALTKPLADDLRAARRLQSYIERLIKRYGHTYKLERQLLQAKQQVNSILDEQHQQDQEEIQKRKDAAKAAREKAKAAAEALRTRQETGLFAALGLGPGGELRAPRIKDLKRLAQRIRKELAGVADPATLRKLSRIEKVLLDPLLAKFPEVRKAAKAMLDELRRGTGAGTARGITYVPPVAFAAAGARPRRTPGIYVAGNVNVYNSHNIGDLENQLTKRQASRAHNRRGAR